MHPHCGSAPDVKAFSAPDYRPVSAQEAFSSEYRSFLRVPLQAFLPDTATEIFNQLNTENRYYDSLHFKGMDFGIVLNEAKPLFQRIDKEKKLEEIFS